MSALVVAVALVAVTTAIGLVWRARTGRVRAAKDAGALDLAGLGLDAPAGERATLLQLSTRFCAQCRPTAQLLGEVAARTPGVRHVEVLLDDRPELADRLGVLQTPTTLLLGRDGQVRGRIAGAPRPAELDAALTSILESADDVR